MTKVKLFLVLVIICYITANVRAQYTRDSAINLVLNQILINEIGNINVFASVDIKSGNKGLPLLYYEPIKYPYDSNWVFFVDDHPFANWDHPCRYIFIDAVTGRDTIITNKYIYPSGIL